MEAIIYLLFIALIPGSIWGGVVLARKWAKTTLARVFLGLALVVVFLIAGTIAIVAGCTAIAGTPNFH